MKYVKDEDFQMNIESFSKIISERWNVDGDLIRNYVFSFISLGLARNSELKREIVKIYNANKLKYYNLAVNSSNINHVIIMQGTLGEQILAQKVLGILLEAEFNNNVRNKIIKLLKKYYPIIYDAVKTCKKDKLKNKYMKMDIISRNVEARFDAAIYFYLVTYVSFENADQGFIISILNDIEEFEFGNIINQNLEGELEKYKIEIQEIKNLLKREYGKVYNHKDILGSNNYHIRNCSKYFEDLFLSNKLDLSYIFHNIEFINIDKVILSYVRVSENKDPNSLIPNIVSGIFMQALINEYKSIRTSYFDNGGEILNNKLEMLEEALEDAECENNNLKSKYEILLKDKDGYDKNLNYELNKLDNYHKQEIKIMQDKINELEKRLIEETNLRLEIESLREYELNFEEVNYNYDLNKSLDEYLGDKKIIIIGGDKEWRRKFRIKYPQIRTLNGFNENFDISILNNSHYIFFYTKYMNHATFHKAMNYIKFNQCNFGYIGKTNMDLVEQEIIENIHNIKKKSNEI